MTINNQERPMRPVPDDNKPHQKILLEHLRDDDEAKGAQTTHSRIVRPQVELFSARDSGELCRG
jgi:hypothetical protein